MKAVTCFFFFGQVYVQYAPPQWKKNKKKKNDLLAMKQILYDMHILTRCRATAETRSRILPDLLNLLAQYHPNHGLLLQHAHSTLTQFILDCTSLNLPSSHRISPKHPLYRDIARKCSDIVYAIHTDRAQQLKNMGLLRKQFLVATDTNLDIVY